MVFDAGAGLRAVSDGGTTALHYAAMSNRPDIHKTQLTLDVDKGTPLGWLRKQSYPCLERFTALQMARVFRYSEVLKALLEGGVNMRRGVSKRIQRCLTH